MSIIYKIEFVWELYFVGIWNDRIFVKLYEEYMYILNVVYFLFGDYI